MYNIDKVKVIDWQMIEPELLGGDLAEELAQVINRSLKYMVEIWWEKKGFKRESKQIYLSLKGGFDKTIRPAVHMAKIVALSVRFGVYDEGAVGVPEWTARDRYIKVIRSCAYQHKCNMQEDCWGGSDESIACVYDLAMAAWVVWDKLNIRDKKYIINMLEYEVDRVLGREPKYYYTPSGQLVDRGISTVYYNTAVANLLSLARMMMPEYERVAEVRDQEKAFYKAIYATSADTENHPYNVDLEGYLCSLGEHSVVATSYISSVANSYILSSLACEGLNQDVYLHYDELYNAFYGLGGGEGDNVGKQCFAVYDKKQRPTSDFNRVKYGKNKIALQGQAYLMDIMAYCLGLGADNEIPPRQWAKVRMKTISYNQNNGKKNYCMRPIYYSKNMRGEIIASYLIDAYLSLFFFATMRSNKVSNREKYKDML